MEAPLPGIVQHHRYSATLGHARCRAHHEVHQRPVAILHEGVAHECQLRLPPLALAHQPRLRIRTAPSGLQIALNLRASAIIAIDLLVSRPS